SRRVAVTLVECSRLSLEPFEAPGTAVEDRARLAAMRLKLVSAVVPEGAPPGLHALVTDAKKEPDLHGGLLRAEASGCRLADEGGAPVARDALARAAGEWVQETLRTRSLAGHHKLLDAVLKQDVAPLLAAHGFQGRGRTFFRVDGELTQLLEVELGRFSTALSLSFWLNVEVFLGALRGEKKLTRELLLTRAYSAWLGRMGALWGNENEAYTLSGEADAAAAGARIQGDLVRHVLPFLDRLRGPDDLVVFLEEQFRKTGDQRYPFAIANVLARTGRKEESKPYFLQVLGTDPAANDALRRTARALGVEI
ncbi:MAG TPA: DUF4304 domain-containing protein, partial [Myxococcales bacterium]|nr:DUF4304 domain-containing protein [Myxococcales bacterium]